jgi:uncharacterized protein YaaQ
VIVLEGGRIAREGPVSDFTKATTTLLVEIDEHHEEMIRLLSTGGVTAVRQGQLLVVADAGDATLDAVRDALAETGARLRRLAPRRGTLADIFRDAPLGV